VHVRRVESGIFGGFWVFLVIRWFGFVGGCRGRIDGAGFGREDQTNQSKCVYKTVNGNLRAGIEKRLKISNSF